MRPLARSESITTKSLGEDLVLFDASNGAVHSLNRVAGIVWRAADGQTDLDALTRIVERTTGVTGARPAVDLAVEQLSRRGLLQTAVERPTAEVRGARREALKRLAVGMAVPMILTMTSARARAQTLSKSLGLSCVVTVNGQTVPGTFKNVGGSLVCVPNLIVPIVNQCDGREEQQCTLPGGGIGICIQGVCQVPA